MNLLIIPLFSPLIMFDDYIPGLVELVEKNRRGSRSLRRAGPRIPDLKEWRFLIHGSTHQKNQLPFGNQTWLAGKFPVHGDFNVKIIHKEWIFQQAMFDCRRL